MTQIKELKDYLKPTSPEYADYNDAPSGWAWAGDFRTPLPNEYYISKSGGVTTLNRVRKNGQKRHIITPVGRAIYECVECGHKTRAGHARSLGNSQYEYLCMVCANAEIYSQY